MFRNFVAVLPFVFAGASTQVSKVYAETINVKFRGTVPERCTLNSHSGGQLGFLQAGNTEYGVTSLKGNSPAVVAITCNRGQRNLSVTAVETVAPTPASFQPSKRWAEAVKLDPHVSQSSSIFFQNGNTGITTGSIQLVSDQTNTIQVDMRAEQVESSQLIAGTYRFNVKLTVTP